MESDTGADRATERTAVDGADKQPLAGMGAGGDDIEGQPLAQGERSFRPLTSGVGHVVATVTVFMLVACALLAAIALMHAFGTVQLLCVYALTPTCIAHPHTLQCAIDSAAMFVPAPCVKQFVATYPDGPPKGVALSTECAYFSTWCAGGVVFMVQFAIVSMAVFCMSPLCRCCAHPRTPAERVAFHRSKSRSLAD